MESKDTIKKVKRQPTEWQKLFANHIDTSYPEYIKNPYNSTIKTVNTVLYLAFFHLTPCQDHSPISLKKTLHSIFHSDNELLFLKITWRKLIREFYE